MFRSVACTFALGTCLLFSPGTRAELVPYADPLEFVPDSFHPWDTQQPFWATLDAAWDSQTHVFEHFTLQIGGGYPVQIEFNEPFVMLSPGWYRGKRQEPLDVSWVLTALPMNQIGAADNCCGYRIELVEAGYSVTFRLDGYTLGEVLGTEAPWLFDYLAGYLDRRSFMFEVINLDTSCPGCVVIGDGFPDDGTIIYRGFYGPSFLDGFEN